MDQQRTTMIAATAGYLRFATKVFATIFIGFGITALVHPPTALGFFELPYPATTFTAEHRKLADVLLAVYGVRDIFMGLAMYAAAYFGGRRTLGWITVAAGAVAVADGAICKWMVGKGEMNHWGYAPVVVGIGGVLALW